MDPCVATLLHYSIVGLPHGNSDRSLRRARRAGSRYRLPQDTAIVSNHGVTAELNTDMGQVRVWRRRLQDQSLVIPDASVSLYFKRPFGLCPHRLLPSRAAVDIK